MNVPYFNRNVFNFVIYNELFLLVISGMGVYFAYVSTTKELSAWLFMPFIFLGSCFTYV